jgi:hypothetical protein
MRLLMTIRSLCRVLAFLSVAASQLGACSPDPHSSRTTAALGTAESFAVLAGSAVTNTGATTIVGNLGVSPGLAITGFPPGMVTAGALHAGDAVALQAQQDVTTTYDSLAGAGLRPRFDRPGSRWSHAHARRLLLLVVGTVDRRAHSRCAGRDSRSLFDALGLGEAGASGGSTEPPTRSAPRTQPPPTPPPRPSTESVEVDLGMVINEDSGKTPSQPS